MTTEPVANLANLEVSATVVGLERWRLTATHNIYGEYSIIEDIDPSGDWVKYADIVALATLPAPTLAVSVQDPMMILAGIKQFGLASDGSDLRDLEAALSKTQAVPAAMGGAGEMVKALRNLVNRTENFWALIQGEYGVRLSSEDQDDHNVYEFFAALEVANAALAGNPPSGGKKRREY